MHPLLAQDMEMVKQMYGENALSPRLFGTIDDIDIELNINMNFLDVSTVHVKMLSKPIHYVIDTANVVNMVHVRLTNSCDQFLLRHFYRLAYFLTLFICLYVKLSNKTIPSGAELLKKDVKQGQSP